MNREAETRIAQHVLEIIDALDVVLIGLLRLKEGIAQDITDGALITKINQRAGELSAFKHQMAVIENDASSIPADIARELGPGADSEEKGVPKPRKAFKSFEATRKRVEGLEKNLEDFIKASIAFSTYEVKIPNEHSLTRGAPTNRAMQKDKTSHHH